MKLNRLMGILVVLTLLLGALGASAEAPADALPPLYVVLADCGWTLYGEESPTENSVVTAVGDPDGLVLSFVEGALPKLVEPEAQIMVLGYNDRLRFAEGVAPVSVGDRAAVGAQVDALRSLAGRQSSLLNAALDELAGRIGALGSGYDVRLMIFSGGAVNYGSADSMNKAIGGAELPLDGVRSALNALREGGVKVSSYVWDLTGSAGLNAAHPQLASLLLNGQVMGESCAMISGGNAREMIAGLCDAVVTGLSGEEYKSPAASALKDADLTELKSNDAAVVLTAANDFEAYIGENIAAELGSRRASAADGDVLRLYSAVNMTEQDRLAIQENKLSALAGQLDADGNGALDAVLEVGGEAVTLSASNIEICSFAADPADAFSVTADAAAGALTFTAQKSGAAKLIVTTADGAASRELSVSAVNYGVTWNLESGAVIYAGESADIAACADPANALEGTVMLNGEPAADAQLSSSLQYAPAEAGRLTVSLSVNGRPSEDHAYAVHYRLGEGEEARSLTLKYPYFKAQAGQTVQVLDAQGSAIPLEDFTASESALADVYFNEAGDGLFIEPRAAGAEVITLTHALSGQTVSLSLTVESLFSDVLFWVTAAGIPVCLVGLTAMIVLLIVKLGGKKR